MVKSHTFEQLPLQNKQALLRIFDGTDLPPLYSDIIAKSVFNADVHPDRLNFLLRNIAVDDTIDVRSGASNEGLHQSKNSKAMVFDIPAWLRDGRLSDLEFQRAAQTFLFTRAELYTSNMLLVQYSVSKAQKKSSFSYRDVNEVLFVVLMVNSPKAFREHDKTCDKYIHRFATRTSDTLLSYLPKTKTIYVQLDKCLAQFKNGVNAEAEDGKPDRLQKWLAMIADVNDEKVRSTAAEDETLSAIQVEIRNMSQDKEVQAMLIQEQFDLMDWTSYGEEREEKGRAEGEAKGRAEGEAIGRAEGRAEGEAIGRAEGENRLAKLISKLLAAGRNDDIERVTKDPQYRRKLYEEFGIENAASDADSEGN